MTAARSWAGWLLWPVAALAVAGHLGLGVLAVIEYARLDWLFSEPYELTAVTVVGGSAFLALAGALRVVWPTVRGGRALRRLLRTASRPLAVPVRAVAESLEVADRVDIVATGEAFAVTHGLVRPRILLSTGMLDALTGAELTAVLLHEHEHLRRRDPLRLLGSRLLAGYGWFLPLLAWWTRRLALRRELAADRAATSLLVGMDTPQLTTDLLSTAAQTLLNDADAVLGPTDDGGWWTLGLRDPTHALVLHDVPMSTSDTRLRTLGALRGRGLRVKLLTWLRDVDTAADAYAVAAGFPHGRFADAVRTHLPHPTTPR